MKREEFDKLSLAKKEEYLFYNLPPDGQNELLRAMCEHTHRGMEITSTLEGIINGLNDLMEQSKLK